MKTKRFLATLALMAAVCTPAFCATPGSDMTASKTNQEKNTTTVYVTRKGKKYHKANCPKLNVRRAFAKKQYVAEREGYKQCKRCHFSFK